MQRSVSIVTAAYRSPYGQERRAHLSVPDAGAPAPGVLLVVEGSPRDPFPRAAAARLADEGFVALVPELPAEERSDRRLVAELEAARGLLAGRPEADRERLGALGFGRGGTLAFLLGCTSRLAAVVDVGGPVLYPELSAERPAQPLELALNLEGAFLGLFTAGDPAVSAREIELLGSALSSAGKSCDIVVLPEAREGSPAEPWLRALAFLRESLGPGPR